MAAFDEKEYTQAFDWSIWKRLFPILARFKGRYLKMIVFTGLTDLLDAALPLFQLYAVAHFIQALAPVGAARYGAGRRQQRHGGEREVSQCPRHGLFR